VGGCLDWVSDSGGLGGVAAAKGGRIT
jgi:hypothetical protein